MKKQEIADKLDVLLGVAIDLNNVAVDATELDSEDVFQFSATFCDGMHELLAGIKEDLHRKELRRRFRQQAKALK